MILLKESEKCIKIIDNNNRTPIQKKSCLIITLLFQKKKANSDIVNAQNDILVNTNVQSKGQHEIVCYS